VAEQWVWTESRGQPLRHWKALIVANYFPYEMRCNMVSAERVRGSSSSPCGF